MPEPAAFQQAFGALLAGRGGAPADPALARALAIHRNTAAKAAQDALADNFPVTHALVGADAFAACAAAFAEARPPAEPRLCLYGEDFAAHVAAWPPFSGLGYLAEAARLERLVGEALFAADADALEAEAFAAGIDPRMRLARHPAVRLLASPAPVVDLWLAHQDEAEPGALDALAWTPQHALVTRPSDRVRVQAATPATLAFLTALGDDGAPLGHAAAVAAESGDVALAFSTAIVAGALVAA